MGYYTRFDLKVTDPSFNDEIIKELRKECEYAAHCLQENGSVNEEGKWYDHEEDMLNFSKKYPDVLFTLNGEGEESEDLWIKYFKNGKMQIAEARIEYDDFDPEKLV